MTRYYTYGEIRRGSVQGNRAKKDGLAPIKTILASEERTGYVALAGATITAIVLFYVIAFAVCRARGWA